MTTGTGHGAESIGFIEWLEGKFVFLFSAGVLRLLVLAGAAVAVLCVPALIYFSFPVPTPEAPPEPAAPTLPGKPSVNAADIQAALAPTPAHQARTQAATSPNPPSAPSADDPDTVAYLGYLGRYRTLADQLHIPWDTVRETVCDSAFYGSCYHWRTVLRRTGMSDLLEKNVYPDTADPATRVQLLQAAEGLYSAIAGGSASVLNLRAIDAPHAASHASAHSSRRTGHGHRSHKAAHKPAAAVAAAEPTAAPTPPKPLEGEDAFRHYYLDPAHTLQKAFHRIEKALPSDFPANAKVTLAGDMYPLATTVVGGLSGTADERAQAVEGFATAYQQKEQSRIAEIAGLMQSHAHAVEQRQEAIDQANAEASAHRQEKAQWRLYMLFGIGAGAITVVLLALLLALLAIERHLRAMRGPALATAPQAPPHVEPEPDPAPALMPG